MTIYSSLVIVEKKNVQTCRQGKVFPTKIWSTYFCQSSEQIVNSNHLETTLDLEWISAVQERVTVSVGLGPRFGPDEF